MPTERQIAASRLAHDAVLPHEDPAAFKDLLASFLRRFRPADAFEESLVRELATAEWRLRRLARIETGLFALRAAPAPGLTAGQTRYSEDTEALARAFYDSCTGDAFIKLMRYEDSIRRAYYKALAQLNRRPHHPAPEPLAHALRPFALPTPPFGRFSGNAT